jgi:hypothetical protein
LWLGGAGRAFAEEPWGPSTTVPQRNQKVITVPAGKRAVFRFSFDSDAANKVIVCTRDSNGKYRRVAVRGNKKLSRAPFVPAVNKKAVKYYVFGWSMPTAPNNKPRWLPSRLNPLTAQKQHVRFSYNDGSRRRPHEGDANNALVDVVIK